MSGQPLELERVLKVLCNHFHGQTPLTPLTPLSTAIFIMRQLNVSRRDFLFGAFPGLFTAPAGNFSCRLSDSEQTHRKCDLYLIPSLHGGAIIRDAAEGAAEGA